MGREQVKYHLKLKFVSETEIRTIYTAKCVSAAPVHSRTHKIDTPLEQRWEGEAHIKQPFSLLFRDTRFPFAIAAGELLLKSRRKQDEHKTWSTGLSLRG